MLATLCLALAPCSPAAPQVSFAPGRDLEIAPGYTIRGILAIDFEGDGDLDFFVPSVGGVVLLENLGQGSFAPAQIIEAVSGSSAPHAGDLDGDGDTDLFWIVAGEIFVSERTAAGGLAPRRLLVSESSYNFELGDVDGDGDADMVTSGNVNLGLLSRYWENVGGVFVPRGTIPGLYWFADLKLVDLDGDGDLDLLRPYERFDFDGTGFVAATALLTDFFADGDIDRDGDVDIVTSNYLGGLDVFLGDGAGAYTQVPIPGTLGRLGNSRPAVADFDGDGDLDFAANHDYRYDLTVAENLGGGLSWSTQSIPVSLSVFNDEAAGCRVADIDGDGDPDLYCATPYDGRIHWFENLALQGTQTCAPTPTSTSPGALLYATGSSEAAARNLRLQARGVPPGGFVLFLGSDAPGSIAIPGSAADLCISLPIGRFDRAGEVRPASPGGHVSAALELGALPVALGGGPVTAGRTLHFQGWFRDSVGGNTSNLTSGLLVDFR